MGSPAVLRTQRIRWNQPGPVTRRLHPVATPCARSDPHSAESGRSDPEPDHPYPAAMSVPGAAAVRVPPFADGDFSRVLCVVAHPDDVEYGTSSAVAAWTARGIDVAYLLLTRGEAGMDASPPDRTRELRTREQLRAAEAVGVTEVTFLDHADGVLEYGLGLRRDVARAIRRYRPDAVLMGSWEVEFMAGLNQADHRVAALATLDAVRDAGNRWVFPEQLDDGLEPHAVRWLLVGGDARPTHGVDVTGEPLERGIASLEAHGEYLAGIPGHPQPRAMITGITALQGRALGVPHAVLFRAFDFQAPPPIALEAMAAAASAPVSD
jgi:LmbE family N-acetylglucosaminyl deacetylase